MTGREGEGVLVAEGGPAGLGWYAWKGIGRAEGPFRGADFVEGGREGRRGVMAGVGAPPLRRPRRALLSEGENLFVGAFGGIVETTLQMPIITYKVCVQEGRALPTTVGAWYRGVGVSAGALAPITAFQMVMNGIFERAVTRGGALEATDAQKIGVAMAAGATSALLYGPVDLIMIQQQKLRMGPLQAARHIVTAGGVLAIERGFFACAGRESIYTAGYLGLGPVFKARLQNSSDAFASSDLAASIVSSSVAGILASFATQPIDTCKTRMQGDLSGSTYPSATRAFLEAVQNPGGLGSLYKGAVARATRISGAFFIVGNIREAAVLYKSATLDPVHALPAGT